MTTTTTRPHLDDLDARLGDLVLPATDPAAAADVTGHNLAAVPTPAAVVRARSAAHVALAVAAAADAGLAVSVQATGHGAGAKAGDDALLVSTRRLTGLVVDPAARTARAEAGVRWRDVIAAAAPYGLAPLCGSSPGVGVAGYTTGGGMGPLGRAFGWAADHVTEIELVTPDGTLRRVDAETEPDLFWGVRGAKHSFGIVTALTFDLMPVARLAGGALLFDVAAAGPLLRAWAAWTPTVDDRTTTNVAVLRLPPLPTVPEPLRGRAVVALRVAHLGPVEEARALIAPLVVAAGTPIVDSLRDMPFSEVGTIASEPTDPVPSWDKGTLLHGLDDAAVDAIVGLVGEDARTPLAVVELRHVGGALCRDPLVANAVGGRDAAYTVNAVGAMMPELREAVPAAGEQLLAAVRPWGTGGTQANLLGWSSDPAEIRSAWPAATYRRLARLKAAWDPQDVFRTGHVVRP
jgi:FAD/FMN-containing dehydrogenase